MSVICPDCNGKRIVVWKVRKKTFDKTSGRVVTRDVEISRKCEWCDGLGVQTAREK